MNTSGCSFYLQVFWELKHKNLLLQLQNVLLFKHNVQNCFV